MILSFTIEYRTHWGEEVRIAGLWPESVPLHTADGICWTAELELDVPEEGATVSYSYQIEQSGAIVRKEWDGFPRTLFLSGTQKRYRISDCWKNSPADLHLCSSAFTEALLAHPERDGFSQSCQKGIVVKACAPRIGNGYCLAICGNQPALGQWNPEKAMLMSDARFPEWQIELDADKLTYPLEYKFILYNKQEKKAACWESHPNRCLADPELKAGETLVVSGQHACFDVPLWKGAGVAIPVFSLKSESSFGIGDFGDLKQLIDWAASTHQKVIQILPINDTTMTRTWKDSYPYNSISIYALHPIYADLTQMGTLNDKDAAWRFSEKQKELNSLPAVDYEAVNQAKWEFFSLLFRQEGEKVLASEGFKEFMKANREWLQPYAAFCYLRDAFKTPDFRQWPRHAVYHADDIEKLCRPGTADYPPISLHYYIQYHLHRQLLSASQYARRHGVALKGDIPIGISRNSVEAWTEPHYFHLDGQAGAPPDDFSVNGQNWGFPTYNWEVMEKDGYRWWMKRFQKMAEYFDAYRIDHILGFFRIWEIPMHAVHGLLGRFVPSLPMSREEIESYGLAFRDEYVHPFIHESFLEELFGAHTAFVRQHFLQPADAPDTYRMRAGFETQREVERHFAGRDDEAAVLIREGLYSLISDVLFIADPKGDGTYHPRIGVQRDFAFRLLDEEEKNAFNRLYEHFYYHRHNEFWHGQAMKKLPRLTQSTRMLVCGEDLGMIPACVPAVMDELRILSLEIQRMPKSPMHEFGRLDEYPYLSVCTISTHDMSTLRGWWEEDERQTQRYYNGTLGHTGAAPATATPELCEEIVRNHLNSHSMLCILSFQDWLSIDGKWRNPNVAEERINVPSNPGNYWRYRMHLTLEQLLEAKTLNEKIGGLIEQTGREPSI